MAVRKAIKKVSEPDNPISEKGVLDADIHRLMTPEAIEDLKILIENPTLQQFLLRWKDADHLLLSEQLREELTAFMKGVYLADNDAMCKNVAEIVTSQNRKMFEFFKSIDKSISSIATDIGAINIQIKDINRRLTIIENKQLEDEKDIANLKEWAKIPMEYDERMKVVESYIKPKKRFARYAIIILLAAALSLILFFQIHDFRLKQRIERQNNTEIQK